MTTIPPTKEQVATLLQVCQRAGGPRAHLFCVKKRKNGRIIWYMLQGANRYHGETFEEVLEKVDLALNVYGFR